MIKAIGLIVFSFFLESEISLFLGTSSFLPLLVLTVLLFLFFDYRYEQKTYYQICVITGFIYDLLFLNRMFLHAFFFLIIGFFYSCIQQKEQSLFIQLFFFLVTIILYRLLEYAIYTMIGYLPISMSLFLQVTLGSLLLNLLYFVLLILLSKIKSGSKSKKRAYHGLG